MTRTSNLQKLPSECFTVLPSDPTLVIGIRRGEMGYFPIRHKDTPEEASAFAASMNERDGVTAEQVIAMEAGSMFGWHVPGADPDAYKGRAQ